MDTLPFGRWFTILSGCYMVDGNSFHLVDGNSYHLMDNKSYHSVNGNR